MSNLEICKHLLPCGYCDVKGAKCDVFYYKCITTTTEAPLNDLVHRQTQSNSVHICDWELMASYYDPVDSVRKCHYKCRICGSKKIEADN